MGVFRATDRENSTPSSTQVVITVLVPNAESPRSMIVPIALALAGGADGLLDLPGGGAPGASLAAAQPRLGNHRRGPLGRQGGDLRGQAQPQQRAAGDLGVPERGTLLKPRSTDLLSVRR